MKIGALDRRLTIQGYTETRDPRSNGLIRTSVDIGTFWANRRDTSSREFFAGGSPQNEQLGVFTIRWRSGIIPGFHMVNDGQVFLITGVSELGRRQYIALQGKALNSNEADGA